jgi:hypothetical protein
VFDSHLTGDDFKSLMAGKVGTRAQVGVVRRAWPNGDKGMATLQFDLGDEDGAEMFRKASTGILQNLSFGTFVYKREKVDARAEGMPEGKAPYLNDKEIGMFKASDWEPFEISPCTVPADFNTCFLSAQPTGEVTISGMPENPGVIDALRAISPQKEKPAMEQTTTQDTGADARTVNEQALAAAREEAVQAERERISEIQSLGATAIKYGIEETVTAEFIAKGVPVDQARKELFAHLAKKGQQGVPPRVGAEGPDFPIRAEGGASVTRDGMEQRLACMQMALLLRADGRFFLARRRDHNGNDSGEYLDGYGPEQQQRAVEMAREYRNFKLIDMAKEALELRGTNPRGMDVTRIGALALQGADRHRRRQPGGGDVASHEPQYQTLGQGPGERG